MVAPQPPLGASAVSQGSMPRGRGHSCDLRAEVALPPSGHLCILGCVQWVGGATENRYDSGCSERTDQGSF